MRLDQALRVLREQTIPALRGSGGDGRAVKHVICEGSRQHVVSWSTKGPRCSEPACEMNLAAAQAKP